MPDVMSSHAFAAFDPMMHYDQYFPPDMMMSENSLPFQQPTDAEIEFMSNAYHDDQGQGQQQQPEGGVSSRGSGLN
jgi:hypothetical protein